MNLFLFLLILISSTLVASQVCSSGQRLSGDTCRSCEVGMYQNFENHQTVACKDCPIGFFANVVAQSECQHCLSGMFSPVVGSVGCNTCELGFYQDQNAQSSCKNCPNGFVQSSSITECTICNAGQYQNTEYLCESCPAGFEQSIAGSIDCNLCSEGTYANFASDGQPSCDNCPIGFYQDKFGQLNCEICTGPTYSPVRSEQCYPCSLVSPCCTGWAVNNDGICEECPAGKFTNTSNPGDSLYTDGTSCDSCPNGSVSIRSATSTGYDKCEVCFPGSSPGTGVFSNTCIQCPAGQYGLDGFCLECTEGKFSSFGASICKDCPAGRFTEVNNTAVCTACPAGESTDNIAGSTACTPCAAGLRSPVDSPTCAATCSVGGQDATPVCNTCTVGLEWFQGNPMFGLPRCVACAAGKFKLDTQTCVPCDATQVANAAGDGCEDCPAPTQPLLGICTNCPTGYKYDTDSCAVCIGGKYQDESGQSTCKDCAVGRFQNLLNQNTCIDCPIGYFVVGLSNALCDQCPEGWVSGVQSEVCSQCISGFGPSMSGDTCSVCPIGQEASTESPFLCIDCPLGRSNGVADSVCTSCAINNYQDEFGQATCKICVLPDLTNIDGIGSSSCETTVNPRCDQGEYFATIVSECTDCLSGRYGIGGAETQCIECPLGYYAATASSACTLCPAGQGIIADGSACTDCEIGRYESDGVCTNCPVGFSQSVLGQSLCPQCLQFEESEEAAISCKACTAAKYTIVDLGRCSTCPSGKVYTGSSNLASDCLECQLGYEPSGTTACLPCRAHHYNIIPGTYCKACPLGWSQEDTGQTFCEECTNNCQGVCPEGSIGVGSACFECPAGKTSLGGRETVCSVCGVGQSQPLVGQTICNECVPGKYTAFSSQSQCKLCTLGQYTSESGQGACRDCIQGTYTDQVGQIQCLTCAIGKFAEDTEVGRQGDCKDCPIGSFGLPTGRCNQCPETTYQDEAGQSTCIGCTVDSLDNILKKPLSEPGASDITQCFDGDGLITYVFGIKDDAKEIQVESSKCEIRPNMVLLCPGCSCNDNSRDGFWAGPVCNECRHGFAGGRVGKCLLKCPGYDGIHDSTMCSGNGKCWYGKYGSGQCLCGGKNTLDATSENIVVDVKTCPAGQKCNGYGDDILLETEYIPYYYLLEYRQYSVFVLQLNTYTPFRGHMWFERYSPQTIYENVCSTCVSQYDSTEYTQVGYFVKDTFSLFPAKTQVLNGFHGENCQYECGACVNYGKCLNTPHPFYYSYTLNSHASEVFTEVFVPQTQCICTSDIYDPDAMCCPHGFEPFVYYGKRQVTPYYQYTALPFITNLVNKQLNYWTNKDLWLQNKYPAYSQANETVQIQVSNVNNIYTGALGTIGVDYREYGPYTKHTFYGTERELCRACPGLFGKGVVSRSVQLQTEQDAEDFWWDTSAKGEKCNGLGVCDFYRQQDEDAVLFFGEFTKAGKVMYQLSRQFAECTAPTRAILPPANNLIDCISEARALNEAAKYVIFSESYKIDITAPGSIIDTNTEWVLNSDGEIPLTLINALKDDATIIGYVTYVGSNGELHAYDFAMELPGTLPNPDANGEYVFHPNTEGECRYPSDTLSCVFLPNSAYSVYELDISGQGDERLEDATFDRFDTCFTYTQSGADKHRIGNYVTEEYENGQDPFLGDNCPKGHFCTENSYMGNVIGFKEACPPGYYQPIEGISRTNPMTHCSRESSSTQDVIDACNPNTATLNPNDYVDKKCVRCPRHMYAAEGASECTECPQGRVKKLSGAADINTVMLNIPAHLNTAFTPWYYIPNETGDEQSDCAQIANGHIHVPALDMYMDYAKPAFMSVIACPFGYSSNPGTYVLYGHEEAVAALHTSSVTLESAILPPFMIFENEEVVEYEYQIVAEGTCTDNGGKYISDVNRCNEARLALGLTDPYKDGELPSTAVTERLPPGCVTGLDNMANGAYFNTESNTNNVIPVIDSSLTQVGKECSSSERFIGNYKTLEKCATACLARSDCQFFIYGTVGLSKEEECWVEYTLSASCNGDTSEQFITRAEFSFYGFGAGRRCGEASGAVVGQAQNYLCICETVKESINDLQEMLVKDYCFPCPSTSVTSAGSMRCTTCFANQLKLYLKDSVAKVVENNAILLSEWILPPEIYKPLRYGVDGFENLQLEQVKDNPALEPISNYWVSKGTYTTLQVVWDKHFNLVYNSGEVCNSEAYVNHGSISEAMKKECRKTCSDDEDCNFVTVQEEDYVRPEIDTTRIKANAQCKTEHTELGFYQNIVDCAVATKALGYNTFIYGMARPAAQMADTYAIVASNMECSTADTLLATGTDLDSCFGLCSAIAGCTTFLIGKGNYAGYCWQEYATKNCPEGKTSNPNVDIYSITPTEYDETLYQCYAEHSTTGCSEGFHEGSILWNTYEIVPRLAMPKGECCFYTTHTRDTDIKTSSTLGYKLDASQYEEVVTMDLSAELTLADAILICNFLYPDRFGWDFIGYAKEARSEQDDFNTVRCVQNKATYTKGTAGAICPDDGQYLPVTSAEECERAALAVTSTVPTIVQIVELPLSPYGCSADFLNTPNSYIFNTLNNNIKRCSLDSTNEFCICKQRGAPQRFDHWNTDEFYSFSKVDGTGLWAESSYPFCAACSPGEHSSFAGGCESCVAGTYSATTDDASLKACKSCDTGQYQPESRGTSCLLCDEGQYQLERGKTSCTECVAGRYATYVGTIDCQDCVAGTAQPGVGKTGCIDCAQGKATSITGQSTCSDCLAGQFQSNFRQIVCPQCTPGMFQTEIGQHSCKTCPSGYYIETNGTTACKTCGAGTYISTTGSVGPSCTACPTSRYAGASGASSCSPCASGHSCSATVSNACVAGRYATGTSGRESCADCTAGKYSTAAANSACTTCPSGKVVDTARIACIDCGGYQFSQIFKSPLVSGGNNCQFQLGIDPTPSPDSTAAGPIKNSLGTDYFGCNDNKGFTITMLKTTSLCWRATACVDYCSLEYNTAGSWTELYVWDWWHTAADTKRCTPTFTKGQQLQLRLQHWGENPTNYKLIMTMLAYNSGDFVIDLNPLPACIANALL